VTQSFTFEGDATIKTGSQIRGLRIVWISQDNNKKKKDEQNDDLIIHVVLDLSLF
jgi:hypothetical protein